jgi:histidinol dehydrogenase
MREEETTTSTGSLPPKFSLAQSNLMKSSRPVKDIVAELREQLATRGARGIVGLSRKFKIMDDNGNGSLSMSEFKKAMKECALQLSDEVNTKYHTVVYLFLLFMLLFELSL